LAENLPEREGNVGRIVALGILAMPLIEIALFVVVGRALGVWLTLGLVLLSTLAGAMLLRLLGLAMVGKIRSTVSAGKLPGERATDAMMVGVAALLLILPGFFSSAVGLVLLLPPVRKQIYRFFSQRLEVVELSTAEYSTRRRDQLSDDTIELDDDEWRPR
jgi:UPF0716 protein FxsA